MLDPMRGEAPILHLQDVSLTLESRPFSLGVKTREHLCVYGDAPHILDALADIVTGHGATLIGDIAIAGRTCTNDPAGRRAIGALDAREPLFDHLSVKDNLAFPLHVRGEKQNQINAQVRRVAALLGLDPFMGESVSALPDEIKFRVKLGRLITYDPQVYVLNQPFGHMSDSAITRCSKLLSTLQRAMQMTILHLTTRRHDALHGPDRIAVLKQGTCAQCADIATLVTRPNSAYVAQVIGQANVLTGYVIKVEEGVADIRLANGSVMQAMAAEAVVMDTLCQLCVRPGHIAVSAAALHVGEDAQSNLPASIQDIRHFGDSVRIRCKLEDGTEMDIRRAAMQYSGTLHLGQTVYLAWSAGHAHALPHEDIWEEEVDTLN